ncbi:MAG: recombinase family protein [Rhodospirillales bacterium]
MQNSPKPIVIYLRVSTRRQGTSGLGLEAQREICRQFAKNHGHEIFAEYEEIETGKGADALDRRPELAKALADARKIKAPLLVAKLDRLSRDVAFISGLMAQKVRFIACDLGPDVDSFALHIFSAFSERERTLISERTKAALAAKRAKGQLLGNLSTLARAQKEGRLTQTFQANIFSTNVLPLIRDIQARGIETYPGIADELNIRGITARRGGKWHPTTVKRILDRHTSEG